MLGVALTKLILILMGTGTLSIAASLGPVGGLLMLVFVFVLITRT